MFRLNFALNMFRLKAARSSRDEREKNEENSVIVIDALHGNFTVPHTISFTHFLSVVCVVPNIDPPNAINTGRISMHSPAHTHSRQKAKNFATHRRSPARAHEENTLRIIIMHTLCV